MVKTCGALLSFNEMAERKEELDLGHNGAGDDCMAQVIKFGGGGAAAGRSL